LNSLSLCDFTHNFAVDGSISLPFQKEEYPITGIIPFNGINNFNHNIAVSTLRKHKLAKNNLFKGSGQKCSHFLIYLIAN